MQFIDKYNNRIQGDYDKSKIKIVFHNGERNNIIFKKNIKVNKLIINLFGNNSYIEIGNNCSFNGIIRISENCKLIIGDNLLSEFNNKFFIGEQTSIIIGNDCMFSGGIIFRTDDSHAIYDVITDNRINIGKDINIGNHVWICENCSILKNTKINDGVVVGMGTILSNCKIANNSIVAGNPYRYIKYNIAWEKPYVNSELFKKGIQKSKYWKKTEFE